MARPRKNAAKVQGSLLAPDEVAEIPVEEQPYPLPEGWKWAYWGSCGDFIAGNAFKPDFQGKKGLLYPFYKVGSLKFSDNKGYLYAIEHSISEETQKSIKASIIPEYSIIFAKIGEAIRLNRRSINEKKCCIDNNLMAFVPQKTTYKYVYYWSLGIDLYKYTNATTVPAIRKTDLEKIVFPLPPLGEQQRIVDRIESLFAKLDDAKAKAEAVLDSFEIRKAAILHKAFTGELTAKWRELKNITLESWSSCPLISVLKENPRNGYSPKPVEYKTNVKSMTLSATTSGFFRPEFFKYIDEEIPENSYLWLSQGDILIQRANSLEKVGTSAIYTSGEHEFIYPDLIMKVQVKNPHSYKYIAYILSTQATLNYFRTNATGTAGNMPKINQQIVSNTPIVVPSSEEQQEIVRTLDRLLEKEQQVKEAVENVLSQIGLMKKAILARAFRGELGTHGASKNSPQ